MLSPFGSELYDYTIYKDFIYIIIQPKTLLTPVGQMLMTTQFNLYTDRISNIKLMCAYDLKIFEKWYIVTKDDHELHLDLYAVDMKIR